MTPAELKARRQARRLSYRDMAAELEHMGHRVSHATLQNWECGRCRITPERVAMLASFFAAAPHDEVPPDPPPLVEWWREREDPPKRLLRLSPAHLDAMQQLAGLDPREADARARRLARVLSAAVARADMVVAEDEADIAGFLDAADRIERVKRLG